MLQRHIALARVPLDRTAPGLTGQARARRSTTATSTSTPQVARPAALQPRSEGPPDMPKTTSQAPRPRRPRPADPVDEGRPSKADRTYDAIVIGGGHNGLTNARLPREGRPEDPRPRAAPPRRRRGDHRGAPARLLVHDVLVRPEPAPAGHHPRARADEARLHADPHAVDVLPDGGRRLPAARPGPRREPPGDRPPLASTTPTRTRRSTTTSARSARRSSRCSTWSRRTSSATTRRS